MLNRAFVEVLMSEPERYTEDVKTLSGLCVVCNGALEEKVISFYNASAFDMPVGPPSFRERTIEGKDGYFCTHCGLRYEFIPGSRGEVRGQY
jgi:hypothetical protein